MISQPSSQGPDPAGPAQKPVAENVPFRLSSPLVRSISPAIIFSRLPVLEMLETSHPAICTPQPSRIARWTPSLRRSSSPAAELEKTTKRTVETRKRAPWAARAPEGPAR